MLSEDVTVWNDGGGVVRAATRPVVGRDRVLAFIAGLVSRYPFGGAQLVDANGESAMWVSLEGRAQFVTVGLRGGSIHQIFAVLNPDKLRHLPAGQSRPAVVRHR